jgi:asparagine synthase (glutamine-hydrolysing)
MSTFAGIVTFDGDPIDRRAEDFAARGVTALRPGRAVTRRVTGALFVQRAPTVGTGEYSDAPLLTSGDGRSLFMALARLDNRAELGAALGLPPAELARIPDSILILRMYERWGDAGVARCLGAFAFALWEASSRRLTLARDCLGNRPLFYHRGREFVAFATTLGALLALPGVPRELDEIALANFIAVNLREKRRTFYRGVERVPSRTLIAIDRDGVCDRQYWTPDFDAAPPFAREDDYIERARELLDIAVKAAMRDTARVAISTSGGLDSSAIAATAARLGQAESITCFSVVAPTGLQIDVGPFRYFDERDKIAALARMHPDLDIRFIAPDRHHHLADDDTNYFVRANRPSLAPAMMGVGYHIMDAVVQAGHRSILIGNYGNCGLSWDGKLSLVSLLRARRWRDLAHETGAVGRGSNRSTARVFATDVLMPIIPMGLRRLIYRLRGRNPDSVARHSALNPAFIAEAGLARQWLAEGFDPWFLPVDWNAARWRADRMFDYNQHARDTRGLSEEVTGVEARDPHADRRLLEFTLSVPEPFFRRDGVPRSFARKVLADRLPREILDERRRGANTPDWFRFLNAKRQDVARDIERLEASPLARRLIDLPRLKTLMMQWPKDEHEAEQRVWEYRRVLARGVHVGRFVRWVEGGNA